MKTSTANRRVLKIPRSPPLTEGADQGGDYILLYVCSDRDASSGLDLKLIATEGNNPYVGSGELHKWRILKVCLGADGLKD